ISMQPISTMRSPPAGFSTVVSVSKTISRIALPCPGDFIGPPESRDKTECRALGVQLWIGHRPYRSRSPRDAFSHHPAFDERGLRLTFVPSFQVARAPARAA